MIARMLLFIKHRLPWLWILVDRLNAHLYCLFHRRRMDARVQQAFSEFRLKGFQFRPLESVDLKGLERLLERQGSVRLKYFQPHGFDHASIEKMLANPAFLMFGVFRAGELVAYFFLRCFWNRKCFVGRLIDENYEGKGIGRVMNRILYYIAWRSGFRCMTTISRSNQQVIRSHQNNPHARFLGNLDNDYIWVEFVEDGEEFLRGA